jgi:hypothetical protein
MLRIPVRPDLPGIGGTLAEAAAFSALSSPHLHFPGTRLSARPRLALVSTLPAPGRSQLTGACGHGIGVAEAQSSAVVLPDKVEIDWP